MEQSAVNSRFGVFCLLTTGFPAFFVIGYMISYLSPIIPILQHMYNVTHTNIHGMPLPDDTWTLYLTLTSTFVVVGAMLGALSLKYLLSAFSRKRVMQVCHFINILAVVILALIGTLTWSPEVIMAGRFLNGIPIGMWYSVIPLMVAEMSAQTTQQTWQSIAAGGFSLGLFLGTAFAHPKVFGTVHGLPALFCIGAAPSIYYIIASFWIPNTPFYLLKQGNQNKAEFVLERLREPNKLAQEEELNLMQTEIKDKPVITTKQMILTKQYRNQLIAVCALYSNLMLVGLNHILFYSTILLEQAGIPPETAPTLTIGIFAAQLFAAFIGAAMVSRFGSLKVNIGANIVIIIAHTLYTISQALSHLAPVAMPTISVVAMGIFLVGFIGGSNSATIGLLGALTTDSTRPTAFFYGTIFLWLTAWLVGFVAPYLQDHLSHYSLTIWLGCSLFFLIYQILFLPDPKGKSVEEIQAKFK